GAPLGGLRRGGAGARRRVPRLPGPRRPSETPRRGGRAAQSLTPKHDSSRAGAARDPQNSRDDQRFTAFTAASASRYPAPTSHSAKPGSGRAVLTIAAATWSGVSLPPAAS